MEGSSSSVRQHPVVAWIVSAVTENLGLKVTSLVIAMALFGLVRGAGSVQRSLEVSLLARLPAPSARRVLLTDLPDKVRVTVGGSPSLVGSLRPDELGPVQIDLSDGHRPSVLIDQALFQLPAGVQIVQVQPSSLQLTWDALIERSVPVRAEVSGTPAPGARLAGPPEVTPARLEVTGAALYVDSIQSVRTDVIDVTGLAPGRYERRVAVQPPRHGVQYDYAAGVRVAFTIDREIIERRLERLSVTALGSARAELRPPMVAVVVRGPPAVINALDPALVVPTVDLGDGHAVHGPTRLGVEVSRLPANVQFVSVEPSEVVVVPAR